VEQARKAVGMKRNPILPVVAVLALLFQTGCYTNLRVNFGNGTGQKIGVKDTQTGQEVQIAPGKFRKIGHSQADLVVTTPDRTRYVFTGVRVADHAMDTRYFPPSSRGFLGLGSWSFDLNVLLQTNMDLYVLLPGKKMVDASVPQPDSYPKAGKKMAD
jgi:hypothetical protein